MLFGSQHDYYALLRVFQQHNWPQLTLTSGFNSYVVREKKIQRL